MSGYQAYTLAQIRQMLFDKVESVPFWVNAEANDAINEALLLWNALTGFWKGTQTISTTPNNWDYQLDSSLVFGTRVTYEGRVLAQETLKAMDSGHPGWQGQTTTSGGSVPNTPQNWFPLSIDMIAIWPADAYGGHVLWVDGIAQTPVLTADDQFIDIGNEELNAILNYALHTLALKEGGDRFAATTDLFKDFLRAAAEENDQLAESDMFRQFIGIDSSRDTRGKPTDYDQMGGRTP